MVKTLTKFNFPSVILTILLFLHPTLHTSVVAAGLAEHQIPYDPDAVDEWIYDNFKSSIETAKGDNTSLDASLIAATKNTTIVMVRQDGKGDFATIKAAVDSVPEGNTKRIVIKIGAGFYKEKIFINRTKPYIAFLGDANAMPTISFNGRAAEYGTLHSATVEVESDYFIASNIIFENSARKPVNGEDGAQAVAMRISGDKGAFYNCKFYGYQDTLCDDKGMHLFKDCYIRGTVDFIFGNGQSIYLGCHIESLAGGKTWITAQARPTATDPGGYAFVHCNITGTGDVYLGRPWQPAARVVFSYTAMGSLINPRGWDQWSKDKDNKRTVFYGEYQCMGPGAASKKRVDYTKLLTNEEAQPFISMSFIEAKKWLLLPPKS